MRAPGFKVSYDEMDSEVQYSILFPGTSNTWFGTTAVGTQGQSKALVVINKNADYPRNVKVSVAGSSGSTVGGTFILNGKDQFGNTIQESIVLSTVADGGTRAGTKVFAEVSSGTFNFSSTMDAGPGTPQVGQAGGGTAVGSLQAYFGLPVKLGAVSDVKRITWINNATPTTFLGGTVPSTGLSGTATVIGTAQSTFSGTANIALTDKFVITVRSSYVAEENYVNY